MQKDRESRPLFLGGGAVGRAPPAYVHSDLQVSSGGKRGKAGIVDGGHVVGGVAQRSLLVLNPRKRRRGLVFFSLT